MLHLADVEDVMPLRRTFARLELVLCVAGAFLLAPRPALASGQGNTGTGSSNSSSSNSNSSNGSGDSSKSSKSSSDDSQGSSKDSGNSTQNSPKNSTDYTSDSSSDWTTNNHGAHVFSIVLAVVIVGATVVGTVLHKAQQERQAKIALAAFMRRQHGLLTHDVAMAEGPLLAAWSHDLRLSAQDQRRLQRALEGFPEQGALMDALDGPIDDLHAVRFAEAFMKVTARAIGAARTQAMIGRATRLTCGD
jgi:hypothetical protein